MKAAKSFTVPAIAALATEDYDSEDTTSLNISHQSIDQEDGKIQDLMNRLMEPQVQALLDSPRRYKISHILEGGDISSSTYNSIIDVICARRTESYLCAINQRESENQRLSATSSSLLCRIVDMVAKSHGVSLYPERQSVFAGKHRCLPPPLFILLLTVTQLCFFLYYWLNSACDSSQMYSVLSPANCGLVPSDSQLVFRSAQRRQIWRFFSYSLLHASWWHLVFNMSIQLLVGVPVELVFGCVRVACVYVSGVVAGSLATSVFDSGRQVALVGASGGVYALLAAHIAHILMQNSGVPLCLARLFIILSAACADIGLSVFNRHASVAPPNGVVVSYVAHIAGAVAGLSLGVVLLLHSSATGRVHWRDRLLWWLAVATYMCCALVAVVYNCMISLATGK